MYRKVFFGDFHNLENSTTFIRHHILHLYECQLHNLDKFTLTFGRMPRFQATPSSSTPV